MVRAAIPDAAESVLKFLPSLGTGEAIAFGDGVTLPARLRFHMLPEHAMPHSTTAKFSEKWSKNITDPKFMEAVVKRWRSSGHPEAEMEPSAPSRPAAQAAGTAQPTRPGPAGGSAMGVPTPPAGQPPQDGQPHMEPRRPGMQPHQTASGFGRQAATPQQSPREGAAAMQQQLRKSFGRQF